MAWPKRTRYTATAARFNVTSSADRRRPARFTADRMLAHHVLARQQTLRMVHAGHSARRADTVLARAAQLAGSSAPATPMTSPARARSRSSAGLKTLM